VYPNELTEALNPPIRYQLNQRRALVVVGVTGRTGHAVERHLGQRAAELLTHPHPRLGVREPHGTQPSFAAAVVETAPSVNDGEPWALVPVYGETTTSTSLRDWARTALAGVPA
jgi:hypothetical protein